MGFRKWTKEENDFLKNNCGKLTTVEIAEKLNRSVRAVYRQAALLNLSMRVKEESKPKEYLLYRGMEVKAGTLDDLAKYVGLKIEELIKYKSSNEKRNVIIM